MKINYLRLLMTIGAIFTISFHNDIFAQGAKEINHTEMLALVIGNASYKNNELAGPEFDAIDISDVLTSIGFKINNSKTITNLNRLSMYSAIDDFIGKVNKNTIAVVYYSGHGVEDLDKKNYLVPIDASLEKYVDLDKQLVSLDWILERLGQREARTKIIILDACRNMPAGLRYKSFGDTGGFAEIKKLAPGTRIIYAASPDSVAMPAPNGQRNSIFTSALLTAIREKNTTFDDILNRAGELTLKATNNKQFPWSQGNLGMSSFNVNLRTHVNPLAQPQIDIFRHQENSVATKPNSDCDEISEQVIVNGVTTWTKKCI